MENVECGVWKMRSMENAEYGKCGVGKMRSMENAEKGIAYNIKTESGKHAGRRY